MKKLLFVYVVFFTLKVSAQLPEFQGSYYKIVSFSEQSKKWEKANSEAQASFYKGIRGHLVTITSSEEENFVDNLLPSTYGGCFIGLQDILQEGKFLWVNGEPFSYTHWYSGEPDNAGNQDYVQKDGHVHGQWDDIQNSGNHSDRYIIEYSKEICNGIDDDGDGLIDETCIPTATIADRYAFEGNNDTTVFKFKITLNHPYDSVITIKYKTIDSTAIADSDYIFRFGTVRINPGSTTKNIEVLVNGDTIVEKNEIFKVQLSNPKNVILGDSIAFGKIKNDDTASLISSNLIGATATETSIKIFPNPVHNLLTITGIKNSTLLNIFSLNGGLFLQKTINSGNSTIDVRGLSSGTYTLEFESNKKIHSLKFVKQ